jgi:hypothetical protein
MILAYVNGSVGYVAIVSLVVQTWLLQVAECAVRCYVLGVNVNHLHLQIRICRARYQFESMLISYC